MKINSLFGMLLANFILLAGCGGSGGGGGNTNTNNPTIPPVTQASPQINVSKSQINFGDVVLDNLAEETISVQNTGSSNLDIGQIAQANSLSAPFSIINDNCSFKQLSPYQTCTFKTRFSPTSQDHFTNAFDIPSSDLNQNPVTVSVEGYGRALSISISQINTNNCPKIELLISVTDKNANPLSGLLSNNFSLFENGVLMDIANFYQVRAPVSVALIADYSLSMINAISDMQVASKILINQLDPGNNEEAAICKFATQYFLMQEFTADKTSLATAIDTPYPGDNIYTHLYDALWAAVDITATRANDRVVILFSDGDPDYSPGSPAKTITEVIAYAKGKGVHIFTVGFGGYVNTEVMNKLATETGGHYFFSTDPKQLSDIYLLISEIIPGRYIIEYNSLSAAGGGDGLDLEANFKSLQGKVSQTIKGCP